MHWAKRLAKTKDSPRESATERASALVMPSWPLLYVLVAVAAAALWLTEKRIELTIRGEQV
jgi:hypothetical protein